MGTFSQQAPRNKNLSHVLEGNSRKCFVSFISFPPALHMFVYVTFTLTLRKAAIFLVSYLANDFLPCFSCLGLHLPHWSQRGLCHSIWRMQVQTKRKDGKGLCTYHEYTGFGIPLCLFPRHPSLLEWVCFQQPHTAGNEVWWHKRGFALLTVTMLLETARDERSFPWIRGAAVSFTFQPPQTVHCMCPLMGSVFGMCS